MMLLLGLIMIDQLSVLAGASLANNKPHSISKKIVGLMSALIFTSIASNSNTTNSRSSNKGTTGTRIVSSSVANQADS